MGLSKYKDYYVYLCHVYRAGKWVYLTAVSETLPPVSQRNVHALWKVQGTTSGDQAKAAVIYHQARSGSTLLQSWPAVEVDRVI